MDILTILKQKFTSGNDVPVTRSSITREEYEAILEHIEFIQDQADEYYKWYVASPVSGYMEYET